MRSATVVGTMLLAAVSLTAYRSGGQAGAGNTAITQVADSYVKAVLAGDAKAVADLYTEDAIEMPPNQPTVKGRTAIQQYYEKLFSGGSKVMNFTLDHLETQASADSAWDVGTYKQSMQGEAGTATPAADTGKYVVILKQVGGAWKVAYAIYNSDQPPRAGR